MMNKNTIPAIRVDEINIDLEQAGKIVWQPLTRERWEFFFRPNIPVEIEIGCGKARFIVSQAVANPKRHYIAVDYAAKWMRRAIKRVCRAKLQNILFVRTDALVLLKEWIPQNRIETFHIYFPDPWPKQKHRNRRLISEGLLKHLHEKLMPGGSLYITTDDQDYYECILRCIQGVKDLWFFEERVNQRYLEGIAPKTNYEEKFEIAGRDRFYLKLTKQ